MSHHRAPPQAPTPRSALRAAALACALSAGLVPQVVIGAPQAGAANHAAHPAAAKAAVGKAAAAAPAPAPTPLLLQKAQDVAIFALGLIGVDYRFGGDTPQRGLDCSGLVRYVFSHTTGIELPRTAAAQGKLGARVSRLDLVPGDLVFFNTRHATDSHVGIYLGDNHFVHAPSKGSEVSIASLDDGYWKKRFTGARRLVGVLTAVEAREADTMAALPSPLAASLAAPAGGGLSLAPPSGVPSLAPADATP